MPKDHWLVPALIATAIVVACARWCPAASAASTGRVSGTVWHDLDGDGTRDGGEPGVADVVIARLGTTARAVSGADGRWTLTLPAGAVTISAVTGWLPSACPGDLHCAAGRRPGQRFAVENQFVRAHVTVKAATTIGGMDLGLLPDHGDPTGRSTSQNTGNDPGDGPALVHDLAARSSAIHWYTGCQDPDVTRACPVGTTLQALGQLYNQGTATARGIRFVVALPPGTLMTGDPVIDAATPGARPTRTGLTGTTSRGGTWIEFSLGRTLPPAASVWFSMAYRITGGPHTPKPYTTHYDHRAYVSVVQVDGGDADSHLLHDPQTGRDRGHNVNWPSATDDDTSDAIEWNTA